MNIYIACIVTAMLAMLLTQIVIVGKQIKKYQLANLKWEWKVFWGADFFIQIAGTVVTVGIGLVLLYLYIQQNPAAKNYPFFIGSFFAFVGYTGTDSATKFFSQINIRYNHAIDYKTTIADKETGNLDAPTPAAKP